jgi:hypothetical protein
MSKTNRFDPFLENQRDTTLAVAFAAAEIEDGKPATYDPCLPPPVPQRQSMSTSNSLDRSPEEIFAKPELHVPASETNGVMLPFMPREASVPYQRHDQAMREHAILAAEINATERDRGRIIRDAAVDIATRSNVAFDQALVAVQMRMGR